MCHFAIISCKNQDFYQKIMKWNQYAELKAQEEEATLPISKLEEKTTVDMKHSELHVFYNTICELRKSSPDFKFEQVKNEGELVETITFTGRRSTIKRNVFDRFEKPGKIA